MKYVHPDELKSAEPITDFRYLLKDRQPLGVRFFKAMIGSKWVFRSVVGAGLATAGLASADVMWGSHNLTNVMNCNVSYLDTERQKLVEVMYNSSNKSMTNTLAGCGQALSRIDGEKRIFVSYVSDSGTVIPGLNILDGMPESVGLRTTIIADEEPQAQLTEAIATNKMEQRYLVQNYMRIAGQSYSGENVQFAMNSAGYAVSDKIKYTIDDIGYWFEDRGNEARDMWNRLWTQSPN